MIEGARLVSEALDAGLTISHAVLAHAALAGDLRTLAHRLEQRGTEVLVGTAAVLRAASPAAAPSGVVALAQPPTYELAQVLEPAPALLLVAVGVQDPGNLGALIRSAEAAGATGVVAAGASADLHGWKTLRGSMGSAFRLPTLHAAHPPQVADFLRARGVRIIATAPRAGRAIYEADLRGPIAIMLGGEGPGLTPAILDAADEVLHVPMHPPVESLNVAVAGALVLFEAFRQRRWEMRDHDSLQSGQKPQGVHRGD